MHGCVDAHLVEEMGYAMTEADLFSGMTRAMSQGAASRRKLSEKVQIHFGREQFVRNAEKIVDRVMEAVT